jgi:uncharacterized protein with PIN domain
MITSDKARELTRIARDLFVKEYEEKYPDVCEKIQKEIEFAATDCKKGIILKNNKESAEKRKELSKYLISKGFKAEFQLDYDLWIGW